MTVEHSAGKLADSPLGVGLAALSAVIFGFGTTFARLAYEGVANPLTIVLIRTVAFVAVMGALLWLLGRARRLKPAALRSTLWMAGTLTMVSLGYQGSVAFIPVSLAALVFYSFPLLVGIFAVAAGRDRMTVWKALALLAAFLGLALVLGSGFALLDWRGVAMALAAALGMALTMTFGGEATRGEDALLMGVYTNAWMLVVLALLTPAFSAVALPVTTAGRLGAAGVCLSYVLAYALWYLALALVRPVRLAALFNIEPLVTLFAAWLVLGEWLSAPQLVGAGLVLASIAAVTVPGRAAQSA
jgi:drug/metabolite transporter (DMT)-like permease